jgi:hypothetical protein
LNAFSGANIGVSNIVGRRAYLTVENVDIQIQDRSGNWRTIHTTQNQSQLMLINMKAVQSRYPQSRVRAVNKAGQLIDLLD